MSDKADKLTLSDDQVYITKGMLLIGRSFTVHIIHMIQHHTFLQISGCLHFAASFLLTLIRRHFQHLPAFSI